MTTPAVNVDERVKDVSFDEDSITVFLMDGRAISVPLVWYPKFTMQRQNSDRLGGFAAVDMAYTGKTLMKI